QHQPDQNRPDQVVLLLDRQRPIVCSDLDIRLREIGLRVRDLHPVIDEERGTEKLGAQLHRKIAADRPHHGRRHDENEQGQRGDTPQTSPPEDPEANALGEGELAQQNRHDQEAGEHADDVHAHEPAGQKVAEEVVQHHGCHSAPSQPVETRDLTNSDVHFYSLRLELPPREISTTGGQHWSRRGGALGPCSVNPQLAFPSRTGGKSRKSQEGHRNTAMRLRSRPHYTWTPNEQREPWTTICRHYRYVTFHI